MCGVSVSKANGAVAVQKGVQERVRKVGTRNNPEVQEAQRGCLGRSSCFQAPPWREHPTLEASLYNCRHVADAKHSVPRPGSARAVLLTLCRDWVTEVS